MSAENSTLTYAIIEDIPDVSDRLRREMDQYAGWLHAGSAASVRQAKKLLNEQQPSLLFCDWDLVGGSGFEVLQHIRQMGGYEPFIIFNTGFQADHPEIAEELINHYKPDAFINKPYWKKLLEQLPGLLAAAAAKHASRHKPGPNIWLTSTDGKRIVVDVCSIICIVQSNEHPRQKIVYSMQYPQGISSQMTWDEVKDILERNEHPYFVANKRQAIICKKYISGAEGSFVYLHHLPFKIEIVKEHVKAFYEWAGIGAAQ